MLSGYTGRCGFDAGYVPALEFAHRAEELEQQRVQRVVILARYLRVSPEEQARTPVRELRAYLDELVALLKRESGPVTPTGSETAG